MALKISFWVTVLFLASIVLVASGSSIGLLPPLERMGSSSYGLGLTGFWLLGFLAMTVNVIAMAYAMIRSKDWIWLIFSFVLAPLTTLYYYWAVYRKKNKETE